jgi:hypothetical protein
MNKLGILKELFEFLAERRKWWLVPIAVFLILFGALFFFSQGSVLAPFIYTIF